MSYWESCPICGMAVELKDDVFYCHPCKLYWLPVGDMEGTYMKYRKKPVVIEAVQWTGENIKEITSFISEYSLMGGDLSICTLEGDMMATVGDYIICGVSGEFYPCKESIFNKTYELA